VRGQARRCPGATRFPDGNPAPSRTDARCHTVGRVSDRPYLPFAKPSITDRERNAVLEVLDSGWLTTGPRTKMFEERFATFVGSEHAIALNSATAALHLALEAVGVGPGDEVIVPTWTFAASAEVVIYLGARPVLVDVDETTLNATTEAMVAAATARTKAAIAVHLGGLPLDIDVLVAAMDARGAAVIEDTAHAFPSRVGGPAGRFAGTFGRAGAFSFYATKTITTGEGGMLVTDDEALASRARVMSLHGISRDAWNRYTATGSWYYEIEDAGFKYNMTDIAAALGIVQLERAEELLNARRELALAYRAAIGGASVADLIDLPIDAPDGSHAWHLFVIRLRLERLRIDRAAVIASLRDAGIGTSVHFIPLHMHPYYRKRWHTSPQEFPVATREYERAISLPIWPGMTEKDIDRVVDAMTDVLEKART
jgi:dTDP-4-amino-4,6-dideoxygalactose transaminase